MMDEPWNNYHAMMDGCVKLERWKKDLIPALSQVTSIQAGCGTTERGLEAYHNQPEREAVGRVNARPTDIENGSEQAF